MSRRKLFDGGPVTPLKIYDENEASVNSARSLKASATKSQRKALSQINLNTQTISATNTPLQKMPKELRFSLNEEPTTATATAAATASATKTKTAVPSIVSIHPSSTLIKTPSSSLSSTSAMSSRASTESRSMNQSISDSPLFALSESLFIEVNENMDTQKDAKIRELSQLIRQFQDDARTLRDVYALELEALRQQIEERNVIIAQLSTPKTRHLVQTEQQTSPQATSQPNQLSPIHDSCLENQTLPSPIAPYNQPILSTISSPSSPSSPSYKTSHTYLKANAIMLEAEKIIMQAEELLHPLQIHQDENEAQNQHEEVASVVAIAAAIEEEDTNSGGNLVVISNQKAMKSAGTQGMNMMSIVDSLQEEVRMLRAQRQRDVITINEMEAVIHSMSLKLEQESRIELEKSASKNQSLVSTMMGLFGINSSQQSSRPVLYNIDQPCDDGEEVKASIDAAIRQRQQKIDTSLAELDALLLF